MFKRCLLSVSDKEGLCELARGIKELSPECEILSTGGTARALQAEGFEVRDIADFTAFPECFDGRLKTLHPKVHGGLLFRRGVDDVQAREVGIEPIDLVVVNLYPFQEAYSQGDQDLIEQIDIGGPTMLRSAAKNAESVVVLCRPEDYSEFLQRAQSGTLDQSYRKTLQARVFAHTAAYDARIAAALSEETYPETLTLSFKRRNKLRYGENPHQHAAVYQQDFWDSGLANYQVHHGKALSYNNLLDVSASLIPLHSQRRCCVVKHAAPCGLAQADSNEKAFELAWQGDPMSAFGSVVSFNHPIEKAEALLLSKRFIEVVVAPDFTPEALDILKEKPSLRLVTYTPAKGRKPASFQQSMVLKDGLALLQQTDSLPPLTLKQVAGTEAPEEALLEFALSVVQALKSNAIALVRQVDGAFQSIGLGGGQPNRVEALQYAIERARKHFGDDALPQAVLASDAFFPFPDSIETAAKAGIKMVVAPGGSVKDEEVAAAAQKLGLSLSFVDHRFFRH